MGLLHTAPQRLPGARVAARSLLGTFLLGIALAGCGKSLPSERQNREAGVTRVAGPGALAANGLATKNTTRLGGANAIADAAAVALAVHPGLTPATRPGVVVLVDKRDWPAALASAALSSAPLGAPLLYTEGNSLPSLSAAALGALHPRGTPVLHGAQVIEIGTSAAPAGYRAHVLASATTAGLAARIERLLARARGAAPRHVIVIGADGPPALAMPAAGLAAESGSPILPVTASGIPGATRRTLIALRHPTIYVVGGSAGVSDATLAKLSRYGTVRRVAVESGTDPVTNAISVARFSDGSFGWGVEEPGHGLVFASTARPLDAPAAASLSASGDFGPLLLLESPTGIPEPLARYLSDIQPSYPEYQPTRGFYNHGWLIGDEAAIAPSTQAELDTLLETLPRSGREQ
ncbi:MAG TPA: cell wall-binding repeat-containing protein [Solirubrobacteraceae bacterium]|jgi:hypothetical protein